MFVRIKCPTCRKKFDFDLDYEICECPKCGQRITVSDSLRREAERQGKRDWIDELNDFSTFFED